MIDLSRVYVNSVLGPARDAPGLARYGMGEYRERPESVRLGGLTFPITYEGSNLDNRLSGKIDTQNAKMYIWSGVVEERQKEIVLHEILHGIDQIIGAGERVPETENIARSEVLFAFLREPRNRRAVEWIMSEAGFEES